MITEQALREAIKTAPINSLQRFRLNNVMRSPFRKPAKARLLAAANEMLAEKQAITISGEGEDQVIEAAVTWVVIIGLLIEFLPVLLEILSRFGG
jgi:Mlc titration factor MtfA (ptsG expression regulator)